MWHVKKVGSKFIVYAQSGRKMGEYDSMKAAEHRVKQAETNWNKISHHIQKHKS